MNSTKGLGAVVGVSVLVLALVNAIVWLVPFIRLDVFWISYVFVWIAVLAFIGGNIYSYVKSTTGKSALYHVSLFVMSTVYMLAACAVSLICMALPFLPIWLVALLQIILLVVFLVGFIGGRTGANIVERMDQTNQAQVSMMQALRAQSQSLLAVAPTPEIKREINVVAEALRYSDPVASAATAAADQQIAQLLTQISAASTAADLLQVQALCQQTNQVIAQRNILCKSMK